MSPFEQQVAEALRSSGPEIGMVGVQGLCERHGVDFLVACEMIRLVLDARAPRVAAAIEAASFECLECNGREHKEKHAAAFVKALRGGGDGAP